MFEAKKEPSEAALRTVARQDSSQTTPNPIKQRMLDIVSEISNGKTKVSKLVEDITRIAEHEHQKYHVFNVPGRAGSTVRPLKITNSNIEMNGGFHTEYGSILVSTAVALVDEAVSQKSNDKAVVRITDAISTLFESTTLSTDDYCESYFAAPERLLAKDKDAQPSLLTYVTENPDMPHILIYKVQKVARKEMSERAGALGR